MYGEKRDNMVIPVPEAESNIAYYDSLYPGDFKMPKQLIHIQRKLCKHLNLYNSVNYAEGQLVSSVIAELLMNAEAYVSEGFWLQMYLGVFVYLFILKPSASCL